MCVRVEGREGEEWAEKLPRFTGELIGSCRAYM